MSDSDLRACLCARGDGVLLMLSVVPNARRTEVDGLHDGALRVRLAAPPIDGRANDALVAWLAKSLGVPKRDVDVLRGESSRRKQASDRRVPRRRRRVARRLAGRRALKAIGRG